jgi:hypothetical protein
VAHSGKTAAATGFARRALAFVADVRAIPYTRPAVRAKKLIKRTLLAVAVVLTVAAGLGYWAFKGTPDFYQRPTMTAQERADAADRAVNKFIRTREWANDVWVNEQRALLAGKGGATNPAATNPAGHAYTVSFTESELNAFFENWSKTQGWDAKYAKYIRDPEVVLRAERLIIVGTVADVGAVASFHFFPTIDDQGKFRLTLERVLAGRLPMPDMVWSAQREKLVNALQRRLPEWQSKAQIAPNGVANEDAIAADTSKLLFDVLNRRPREPVLFLPFKEHAAVPVRLTAVHVTDGELSLTVEPMTATERATLLDRIRQPDPSMTAAAQ